MGVYSVDKLISEARRLAREYREATGKTLPISGEIAINDAIRLLGMQPATGVTNGYDALFSYREQELRVQIKGRAISHNRRSGHRLGQLKLEQEWDAIMMVIMDDNYETTEMYMASRDAIVEALGNGKNRRGSISVARFRNIGKLLWTVENGIEDDGYWDNSG